MSRSRTLVWIPLHSWRHRWVSSAFLVCPRSCLPGVLHSSEPCDRYPWIQCLHSCPGRFKGEYRGRCLAQVPPIPPLPDSIRYNQKVRARYDAAPAQSATLEQLVENEKGEKKRTATEGLMWLVRGLSFTCKALQITQANQSSELAVAFSQSYEGTLKKFHNIIVKGIFAVRGYNLFQLWLFNDYETR